MMMTTIVRSIYCAHVGDDCEKEMREKVSIDERDICCKKIVTVFRCES